MSISKLLNNTASYHDEFIAHLTNLEEANLYLDIAIKEYKEDGDAEALLVALQNVAEANGRTNK